MDYRKASLTFTRRTVCSEQIEIAKSRLKSFILFATLYIATLYDWQKISRQPPTDRKSNQTNSCLVCTCSRASHGYTYLRLVLIGSLDFPNYCDWPIVVLTLMQLCACFWASLSSVVCPLLLAGSGFTKYHHENIEVSCLWSSRIYKVSYVFLS